MQQIGDEQRGWAWTRALQGVPANEIHLCGDGSALPLVRRLAAEMNEPLEVRCTESRTMILHVRRPDGCGFSAGTANIQGLQSQLCGCHICVIATCKQSQGLTGTLWAGARVREIHTADGGVTRS